MWAPVAHLFRFSCGHGVIVVVTFGSTCGTLCHCFILFFMPNILLELVFSSPKCGHASKSQMFLGLSQEEPCKL